jgi:hypothetical protein
MQVDPHLFLLRLASWPVNIMIFCKLFCLTPVFVVVLFTSVLIMKSRKRLALNETKERKSTPLAHWPAIVFI